MVINVKALHTNAFVKPFTVVLWRFFLNEIVKEDFVLLKSKSGINAFLIRAQVKAMVICISLLSMNYLAHAYLSFNNPEILAGNMISDYIKGKKQFDYPPVVQKGIKLHRAIDHFTDTHAATQELKSFFRPQYRLYSGAFADVVYDHFLANDTLQFGTENDLQEFAVATYELLDDFTGIFPPGFQKIFPYMKQYDWLSNYRHTWGIEKSFAGLVRRAAYLTESEKAFEIFNTHYAGMQICYNTFFPDIKKYSFNQLGELLNS